MSSQRSTRSVHLLRIGGSDAGSVDGTDAEQHPARPSSSASASASYAAGVEHGRGRPTARALRRRRRAPTGRPARTVHASARRPALGDRGEHAPRARRRPRAGARSGAGRSRTRSAPGRRARRAAPARRPARSARSTPGSRRRTSATWSRSPSASAWASSRRAPWSESTLSPRGFSTVAASVHGPATWTLNGAGVALGLLLDRVEVLGQQRARPAVVDAGRVGQPPPGGLEVDARARRRPPARGRSWSAATPRPGSSGRCGQVGQLAEHEPDRLGVVRASSPGHRPDAGRERHAEPLEGGRVPARAVARSWPSRRPGCRRRSRPPGRARCPTPGRAARSRRVVARRTTRPPDGAVLVAVRAQLHRALQRRRRHGAAPARPDRRDPVDRELLARADGDGAGDRLDVEHEARLAVRRRACRCRSPRAGRS